MQLKPECVRVDKPGNVKSLAYVRIIELVVVSMCTSMWLWSVCVYQ